MHVKVAQIRYSVHLDPKSLTLVRNPLPCFVLYLKVYEESLLKILFATDYFKIKTSFSILPAIHLFSLPDIALIATQLSMVRNKILILSGKGGVGKSSFTTNLSLALSFNESVSVGVLDVDMCGPSLPRMFGIEKESIHQSSTGWSPIYVHDNLSVMSIAFLLESLDTAVVWRGPKKNGEKRSMIINYRIEDRVERNERLKNLWNSES